MRVVRGLRCSHGMTNTKKIIIAFTFGFALLGAFGACGGTEEPTTETFKAELRPIDLTGQDCVACGCHVNGMVCYCDTQAEKDCIDRRH